MEEYSSTLICYLGQRKETDLGEIVRFYGLDYFYKEVGGQSK